MSRTDLTLEQAVDSYLRRSMDSIIQESRKTREKYPVDISDGMTKSFNIVTVAHCSFAMAEVHYNNLKNKKIPVTLYKRVNGNCWMKVKEYLGVGTSEIAYQS